MVVVNVPKDEKIEALLNDLNDDVLELKEEISVTRKQGIDTRIADTLMLEIPAKFRLARASYAKDDINSIKKSIAMVKHELEAAKDGTEFDAALELIHKAYQAVRDGEKKKAIVLYTKIVSIYKKLPKDLRRTIYVASLDLKNKIEKAASAPKTDKDLLKGVRVRMDDSIQKIGNEIDKKHKFSLFRKLGLRK